MTLRRKISPFEILVAALLGVALLWRFAYFLEMYASPYAFDLGIDGEVFHESALEVAGGRWTNKETFYQAPVYSRFLGLIYIFFGAGPTIAKLIQILLSVASCWLIFDVARRVFDRGVGVIALGFSSIYGLFIFYSGEFVAVTLFMFLSLLALDCLLRASEKDRLAGWGLAGLAFGLAAITRGTILPFVAVVVFWIVASRWSTDGPPRAFFEAAVFCVGVGLMIAPVSLHNYRADGNLVLIASNDGLNFYMGNNPDSDGMTTAVVGMRGDQRGSTEDQLRVGREDLGDPEASPGAVSRSWYRKGFRFIAESPRQALGLTLRKAFLLVNAYEVGNVRVIDFVARHSRVFRQATLRYWLILPLAAAGLLIGRGRKPEVFLLYAFVGIYSIVVVAFVVTARYRLPIVPILIIFASAAIKQWYDWLVDRGWTAGWRSALRIGASVILAIGVALVARPTPSIRNADAQAFFGEAEAYRKQGDFAAAATWYENALADYPEYCDAAHNLGRIHAEVFADPEQAVEILRAVIPACAGDLEVRRLLGLVLCAANQCGEGIAHLRYVAERAPDSVGAQADLERARRIVGPD